MTDQQQGPLNPETFIDTPLRQAMRRAFDSPTYANIEAVAAVSRAGVDAFPDCWEGDLPTEHPNRCTLRDKLLYADIFNDDGSHRATWRCHKREGHDGPCSSHNDCGVMNGGVVCGLLPGHKGPHSWQQFIHATAFPRLTRSPR